MPTPSSQLLSVWIKDGLDNENFLLLEEVAFVILRQRLPKYSDDGIWELIEANLSSIANNLRNEAAECSMDGVPPRFEIDDEQSPYIKAFPVDNVLLAKLRRIDPYVVEDLCAKILEKLGATARVTSRSGDGGVDFIASNLDIVPAGYGIPAVCRATVIGQTKRYKEKML